MAKTTADRLKKIMAKIQNRYMTDEYDDGYSIWLGGEYKELRLIINDDDTVTVKLLDESCTTQPPFDIIKDIVSTRWGSRTYGRSIFLYDPEGGYMHEEGCDTKTILEEINGFNDCIPRHFEDNYGALDVKTCEIESHILSPIGFEYRATFICEPTKEQLNYIDKQFDDTVMDEVREFFKAKGVEVSFSSQDQFTLKQ